MAPATKSRTNVMHCTSSVQCFSFSNIVYDFFVKLTCMRECVCVRAACSHKCMPTWQGRSQAMRRPAGSDAPDNAVKQQTDLLSFGTGQEENTSPWKMGWERRTLSSMTDIRLWLMTKKRHQWTVWSVVNKNSKGNSLWAEPNNIQWAISKKLL